MGLLNPGGPIAQFKRNRCSISPVELILQSGVRKQLIDASYTFARLCQALAERLGIRFADAGKWDISLAYDGVHFTEHGHKAFAAGLLEELK